MEEYDLTDTLSDGAVALKLRSDKHPDGERYVFRSPTGEVGLWLKNLIEFGQKAALGFEVGADSLKKLVLSDEDEQDVYARVMGDTLQLMVDDGVIWENIQDVFGLLLKKWGAGKRISESLEEIRGEAPARVNRATRRAVTKKAPAKPSSRKAGSRSSRASSATKAPTAARASTRSRKTSEDGDTSQTA